MVMFCKYTSGVVVQQFNDAGEFVTSQFVSDDTVSYSITDNGIELEINQDDMPLAGREYHPFDMVVE